MFTEAPLENAGFRDKYFHNSLIVDSNGMHRIQAAVKENGLYCVLGFSERYQGSLYISQVSDKEAVLSSKTELALTRQMGLY